MWFFCLMEWSKGWAVSLITIGGGVGDYSMEMGSMTEMIHLKTKRWGE